jgi:hypothetical protein
LQGSLWAYTIILLLLLGAQIAVGVVTYKATPSQQKNVISDVSILLLFLFFLHESPLDCIFSSFR